MAGAADVDAAARGRAIRRAGALLALALLAPLSGLAVAAGAADKVRCKSVESIGVAWMMQDGAVTLRLHTLAPGPVGESPLRYRPGDPHYDEIKHHLGGIAPGEIKSVPPWCRAVLKAAPD